MGWEIVDSRSEKGVSGYKVSANDRDAIIEIREAATKKKFDVLLVYMFDRLGRKEDETPFIVQWFINNGIEVWSAVEGQQKIEQHIDKLLNYIRFWQAQGESEKTSIHVKTAHAQLTQDGLFRGGVVPFGYRLEHKGRVGKNGFPIGDYVIDEQEAVVVRRIFDRYVSYGYGTHRICSYLAEVGLTPRAGGRFVNTTVQNMLKRPLYVGVLSAGGVKSDVFPHLQIVTQDVFDRAQEIMRDRSQKYAERRIPLNTKGSALLTGFIFCGHCGGRLALTTNGKKYNRKDGNVIVSPKLRYVCYNKTRYPGSCNGQTGYTTSKLDGIVEKIVKSIFSKVKEKSIDETISAQYEKHIAEIKLNLEQERSELANELQIMSVLGDEVLSVIHGTSTLKPEMLNKKYDEVNSAINEKESIVKMLEQELANANDAVNKITKQYNDILTWADMYAASAMDVKKMVVAQLIREIRVSEGYNIEIDFRISERQLGIEQDIGKTPKREK
jgi:DNA invertase Pin-like site-specific DNA recombinase